MDLILDYQIQPGDTDGLGHMSVARYAEIAEGACPSVLAKAGIDKMWLGSHGSIPLAVDVYTRQYHEQFAGDTLRLNGGFLGVDGSDLTLYVEVRNRTSNELAAASTQRVRLFGRHDRERRPLPAEAAEAIRRQAIEWPAEGRPRTLALSTINVPSVEQLHRSPLELWSEGSIAPGECDDTGWYVGGLTRLAWGPRRQRDTAGPYLPASWLFSGPDGQRLGLANMESRRVLVKSPRDGTHIRTVAANIEIGPNYRVRREWSFDPISGVVHAAGDFVDLLIDPGVRRAVPMPPAVKDELELRFNPSLR